MRPFKRLSDGMLSPGTTWLMVLFVFFATILCSAQSVRAEDSSPSPYVNIYGFGSVGSDMETMSNAALGLGWLARAGIRMDWLGLFVECQRDHWVALETDIHFNKGVLNMGIGADVLLMDGRLKMSLAMGTSTLMFDAIFDKAGTTGFYIDFQPTVFRWPLWSKLVLEFSPFGAVLQVPAVAAPMLKRLAYRTSVGLEWQF